MDKSILDTVHETAQGLHKSGVIDDVTMKTFDAMCLPKVKALSPSDIKHIRKKEKVSQKVFALCLNTSASTIRQWEQGDKKPAGISLKMLHLVKERGINILL